MWRKLLDWIDGILNRVTMYRLILYYLIALLVVAIGFSALNVLPYDPLALAASAVFILGVCLLANEVFAKVWKVPANAESAYITAFILTLIITPLKLPHQGAFIETALWASAIAIASKYVIAIKKKHIWNPAAFGVAATALFLNDPATWWVATAALAPFVLLGGLLLVRKLQRSDLVWSFSLVALATIVATNAGGNLGLPTILQRALLDAPLLFFGFVMLTEPLTSPPTRPRRIVYGAFVGLLFAPAVHLGSVYSTPELALLFGNVLSYLMSPKQKLVLTLKEKVQIAPDMYDFAFAGGEEMRFRPGQYMEWTLGHEKTDSRGNRRYFTLASSPTEDDIRLGVKFYERSSSFKRALLNLDDGQTIVAGQLAGDFTLPRDKRKKLAFIAGGIGITPFRSMVKYLLDKKEVRPAVLIYSNRNAEDIVYSNLFARAERELDLKTVYTLTETAPVDWRGEKGRVSAALIARNVPDWRERTFYVSGTHAMVAATESVLKGMGVPPGRIKTDFFPGFA